MVSDVLNQMKKHSYGSGPRTWLSWPSGRVSWLPVLGLSCSIPWRCWMLPWFEFLRGDFLAFVLFSIFVSFSLTHSLDKSEFFPLTCFLLSSFKSIPTFFSLLFLFDFRSYCQIFLSSVFFYFLHFMLPHIFFPISLNFHLLSISFSFSNSFLTSHSIYFPSCIPPAFYNILFLFSKLSFHTLLSGMPHSKPPRTIEAPNLDALTRLGTHNAHMINVSNQHVLELR